MCALRLKTVLEISRMFTELPVVSGDRSISLIPIRYSMMQSPKTPATGTVRADKSAASYHATFSLPQRQQSSTPALKYSVISQFILIVLHVTPRDLDRYPTMHIW